jgi:hypothetical protein
MYIKICYKFIYYFLNSEELFVIESFMFNAQPCDTVLYTDRQA